MTKKQAEMKKKEIGCWGHYCKLNLRCRSISRIQLIVEAVLEGRPADILATNDKAFERAKAQALCLHSDLNVVEMDYFKVVVDERLMEMDAKTLETEVA